MAPDVTHLYPEMHHRLDALLADPEAKQIGLFVVSGFRPLAKQAELFAAAVKKYGSAKAAAKWVAPPGHSNHGPSIDAHGHHTNDQVHAGVYGGAVDLGVPGTRAVSGQWPIQLEKNVNRVAARHGLYSPMDWEDWHFEMIPGWHAAADPGASMPPIVTGALAHGGIVALWQQLLNDHASMHLTVNGSFDAATVEATREFQAMAGLHGEDGTKVDAPTWGKMITLTK